jgi:ankyrin repeat protein
MKINRIVLVSLLMFPFIAQGQDKAEEFLAAARKGDLASVKAMLDAGLDVNTKTRYGATALSYACDRGNVELVKLLIERGANVNAQDSFYGATPLTWAADKGHAEIVRLLLEKGARGVDMVIMVGVQRGNPAIVKAALDRGGALPQTLTQALGQAEASGQTEIVQMLKAAGAKPRDLPKVQIEEETLKSYAGVYRNDQIGDLTFRFTDGKLTGQLAGQGSFNVAASDKTTFSIVEVPATIKFKVEGDKVTGFALTQNGMTFDFKKVEKDK